jgi:hypothetical protein
LKTCEYEIKGRKYKQERLVFGQMEQLEYLMKDVSLPDRMDIRSILSLLLRKGLLVKACAIILIPDGIEIENKNIDEIEKILRWSMHPDIGATVITDFFACTPVSSVLTPITGAMASIATMLNLTPAGSTNSSQSSPEETSPREEPSNGDTD